MARQAESGLVRLGLSDTVRLDIYIFKCLWFLTMVISLNDTF